MSRVYSTTVLELVNFTGNYTWSNGTGELVVVKNVNVYYGGLSLGVFKLFAPGGNTVLYAQLGTGLAPFVNWQDQRIVVPPGDSIQVGTDIGCDVGIYGFGLTLP